MVPPRGVNLIAFDRKLSRMRRTFPRSANGVRSSTCTSRRTRCPTSVSCWFSSTDLIKGRSLNSETSRPTLLACQALNDSRFSISLCNFIPLSRKIASDLPLSALQLTDCAVHQEFGPFANIRQRRLQFMRHVSQESILFLGELEKPHAQPFELGGQALEVRGPRMAIGREKVPRPSSLIERSMARIGRPKR